MAEFEFKDRYKALGIPYPDPATTCMGDCEGTGVVPVHEDDPDDRYFQAWRDAEAKQPSEDGYHFLICPDCDGTGKRKAAGEGKHGER